MPAIGKITLDIKDYEKALNRARQQGQKFAAGSQQDFQKVGKGASKAGSLISAISSEAGGAFGKLGSAIGAVASGPLVALTAALGALVALGVDIWDHMTLSAEEYAKKLDIAAQAAEKNRAAVEQQAAEDAGYMERLRELASREQLSNEAKAEAATLIKNLSSRYGDLGISIDEVTGSIKGADEAQKRFLERQKQMRMQALRDQITATGRQARTQAKVAVKEGSAWGRNARAENVTSIMSSAPIETRIKMAEKYRDSSKTQADMDRWQKLVELLTKQRDLQREYNMLRQTGAATEKEQTAAMRKKSDRAETERAAQIQIEKRAEDYYSSTLSNLDNQLKLQELINAGKLEEAKRQQLINDLESKGIPVEEARLAAISEAQARLNSAKLAQTQSQQAASLYDRALRAAGRGQEADTRAALEQARQRKGGDLTEEEKSRTLEMLSLSQQLDKLTGLNGFGSMAIQTNSLTSRGGFQTGAAAPDVDKYNRIIAENGKTMLSVVQRIETICRQFGNF